MIKYKKLSTMLVIIVLVIRTKIIFWYNFDLVTEELKENCICVAINYLSGRHIKVVIFNGSLQIILA